MAINEELAQEDDSQSGLRFGLAILLTTIWVTLAMAFNIAFNHRIGIFADVTLVASSLLISLKINQKDFLASYCAPAIAWLVSLITVGQFATNAGGSWKVQQVFLLVYGLGSHFLWILAATIIAVLTHYFRGRTD